MRTSMLLMSMVQAGMAIAAVRGKFVYEGGIIQPGVRQAHNGVLYQLGFDTDGSQHMVPYEQSSTYEITPLTGKRSFLAEEGGENLLRVWRIDKPGIIIAKTSPSTGLQVFTEYPEGQRVRVA